MALAKGRWEHRDAEGDLVARGKIKMLESYGQAIPKMLRTLEAQKTFHRAYDP
jgi:hypothetical protein